MYFRVKDLELHMLETLHIPQAPFMADTDRIMYLTVAQQKSSETIRRLSDDDKPR
jgi:hypothetical protein